MSEDEPELKAQECTLSRVVQHFKKESVCWTLEECAAALLF